MGCVEEAEIKNFGIGFVGMNLQITFHSNKDHVSIFRIVNWVLLATLGVVWRVVVRIAASSCSYTHPPPKPLSGRIDFPLKPVDNLMSSIPLIRPLHSTSNSWLQIACGEFHFRLVIHLFNKIKKKQFFSVMFDQGIILCHGFNFSCTVNSPLWKQTLCSVFLIHLIFCLVVFNFLCLFFFFFSFPSPDFPITSVFFWLIWFLFWGLFFLILSSACHSSFCYEMLSFHIFRSPYELNLPS